MKKPVFHHSNTLYTLSWILTVPILLDISTACTLLSFWLVGLLYFIVLAISLVRIGHGIAQKCWKFCLSLGAQLLAGALILAFFQLSFKGIINTPFSHSKAPDIVEIANPATDTLKGEIPEIKVNPIPVDSVTPYHSRIIDPELERAHR